MNNILIFKFDADIPIEDLIGTLFLSRIATESLHGTVLAQINIRTHINRRERRIAIDTDSVCGRDLAKLFTGFARKEYGWRKFTIERASDVPCPEAKQ